MNLVNELQVSAEQDDVMTVLRKTMRLASKLNRDDISGWLEAEQSGYPDNLNVPDYRRIRVTFAYNTNGFISAGFGRLMNGVQELPTDIDVKVPVGSPLSAVMAWVAQMDKGHGIYQPVDEKMDQALRGMYQFHPMYAKQISLMLRLNDSEVRAIPERIKDKVLHWALALERAGVTGDGMTFSVKDKEIAQTVTFNIYGHIEQLSNSGTNLKSGQ
jgi:AbiTii